MKKDQPTDFVTLRCYKFCFRWKRKRICDTDSIILAVNEKGREEKSKQKAEEQFLQPLLRIILKCNPMCPINTSMTQHINNKINFTFNTDYVCVCTMNPSVISTCIIPLLLLVLVLRLTPIYLRSFLLYSALRFLEFGIAVAMFQKANLVSRIHSASSLKPDLAFRLSETRR